MRPVVCWTVMDACLGDFAPIHSHSHRRERSSITVHFYVPIVAVGHLGSMAMALGDAMLPPVKFESTPEVLLINVTLAPLRFAIQALPPASIDTEDGPLRPPPWKMVLAEPSALILATVLLPALAIQAKPLWSRAIAVGPLSGPVVKPVVPERNPVASAAEVPRASSFETELLPEFGIQMFPEPSAAMADGVESPPPE